MDAYFATTDFPAENPYTQTRDFSYTHVGSNKSNQYMTKPFTLLKLIFSLSSYAQKNATNNIITKNEYFIIKTMPLNKNQLIDQANKIISFKYPEFVFDSLLYEITAWKNSKKTIVNYRRIIRFTLLTKRMKI